MHGKMKITWLSREDLLKLDSNLPIDNFEDITPFYDACEEHLLDLGFELWDDDIELEKNVKTKNGIEFRYNCAIVKTHEKDDKYIVDEFGVAYWYINNTRMNDFEKLIYATNHLRMSTIGGKPEDDSKKAMDYLMELINKMKDNKIKNIK